MQPSRISTQAGGADSGAQDSQGASRGLKSKTARSSIGNLFVDGLPKEPSAAGARAALSSRGAGGVGQRMGILIRARDDGFGDGFANSRVASAGRGTLGQLPFQKGPQNFPSADPQEHPAGFQSASASLGIAVAEVWHCTVASPVHSAGDWRARASLWRPT